jgi:hypothetical protein
VYENIQVYPGEFYLPSDCPVFLHAEEYGIKKHGESIFSLVFEDFSMPSYSNYPYPYQFDNDEDQFRISGIIRNKVDEIKSKSPENNFMVFQNSHDGLRIEVRRDGQETVHALDAKEREIYLSAVETSRQVDQVCAALGMPPEDVTSILTDFERKGIILYSSDRKSFLSLAMKSEGNSLDPRGMKQGQT